MAKNSTLNRVQNSATESKEQVASTVEQLMLASLGLVGMAQDERMKMRERSETMFNDLVKRGESLRIDSERQLRRVLRRSQSRAEKVEDTLEARINETLTRLSVPSRQDIDRLSAQLDLLIARLDERNTIAEAVLPMNDYDELTSKQIIEAVQDLSSDNLAQILTYELAHANRITVTREIERLIAARAEDERELAAPEQA